MFKGAITAALIAAAMLTGCEVEEGETIGPRGGVVASDDGRLTLWIPPGALDDEVPIQIEAIDDGPPDAVGPSYEILPRGTVFNAPAELTYDVSEGMEDVEPGRLVVVGEGADGWSRLADFELDMDELVMRASVLYLSAYAPIMD